MNAFKYSRAGASFLFFAACAVFWAGVCPGYQKFQEWFQLFQFTPEYFRDLVLTPGGLAAWCGRFLMQFYYYPWAGGASIAVVLTGIQLLTYSLSRNRNSLTFALSFIPAAIFFVLLCAREVFLTPAVSALLCLVAARCLVRTSKLIQVLATPFVWFLSGPFALIFVAACICSDTEFRPVPALIQLALWLLCPAAFSLLMPYQFRNLLVGIYSSRSLWTAPVLACLACAVTIGSVVANSRKLPSNVIAAAVTYVAFAVTVFWGINGFIDSRMENLLEYGQLVNQEDWDAVIRKSDGDRTTAEDVHLQSNESSDQWVINDSYTLKYSTIAQAYAHKGSLVQNLFTRFCPGPDGLFPKYDKDSHLKNVFVSDVYYHIGMISQAREVMFESMETIPDKQKGPRSYTRLAETNSIDGNTAVADKYLEALSHTMFYSGYAASFDHSGPEMEQYRRFRYKGRQYPFNDNMMLSELADLVSQNPDNNIACQYLVALTLLQKDLKYLNQVVSMVYRDDVAALPDPLQQAMTVKLVMSDDFDGRIPPYISRDNVKKGMAFVEEFDKLGSLSGSHRRSAVNSLRKKFGDTYYFFYYLQ